LQDLGDRRVLGLESQVRARQAHLGEAGADGGLAGDERRAAGRAALLAVPVGEHPAFLRNAVDVRRPVPHDTVVVGADIEPADVIAPDDEDVGLLGRHRSTPSLSCPLPHRRTELQTLLSCHPGTPAAWARGFVGTAPVGAGFNSNVTFSILPPNANGIL